MKISLSDPRLSETVPLLDNQAENGVEIETPVEETPLLEYRRAGDEAFFTISEHRPGVPNEVGVRIENGQFAFFPKRSAAHRDLLRKLGEMT